MSSRSIPLLPFFALVGACSTTPFAAPSAAPAPSRRVGPAAPRTDPRLDELARRWDASRLPVSDAAPSTASGPVLQLVGARAQLDESDLDGPAALAARLPRAGSVRAWIEETRSIRDLLPYLEVLPAGTTLYLATRGEGRLGWLRARPLETPRCTNFLALTGATVADLVRAAGSSGWPGDDEVALDNRVCGGSWRARFDALRTGGGTVYVRTDQGDRPACSRLTFESDRRLVRAGDGAHRPTLAFDVSVKRLPYGYQKEERDAVDITSATGDRSAADLTCRTKYWAANDDAVSLSIETSVYKLGSVAFQRTRMFHSEAACLAAPADKAPARHCLPSLLASTSTQPDRVIDRVAPIEARRGSLFARSDGACRAIRFGKTSSTSDGIYREEELAYYPSSSTMLSSWLTVHGGLSSDDWGSYTTPVVHTHEDHVIVGRERWYLTRSACERARFSVARP